MKLTSGACVIACVIALSSTLSAQWPKHTTPNVPRLANGAVDLNAPTPRTPDGKPDLSGQWGRAPGGPRGAGAAPPPPPPGTPPLATFFDVGAGFPEGLPFQPWAAELKKQRNAANSKDNPDALCLPMGTCSSTCTGSRG